MRKPHPQLHVVMNKWGAVFIQGVSERTMVLILSRLSVAYRL